MEEYADFYLETTRDLIKRRSFVTGSNKRAVNIVRDVINVVPVHWACEEVVGTYAGMICLV
jgi:linoleate 10R-lipoxygenase